MNFWSKLWQELNVLGRSLVVVSILIAATAVTSGVFYLLPVSSISYMEQSALASGVLSAVKEESRGLVGITAPVRHIATPEAVKAVYMTACTASVPVLRERLLGLMKGTEINSYVIDIKDYTGTIAYDFPNVRGPKGQGCRITDLPSFIERLHKDGIYTIARVTVFQDPLYSAMSPDIAVQSVSKPGTPWKDNKGLSYIDPNSVSYWKYISALGKDAYAIGFDEINFDYIRFPSDGNIPDMLFATPPGMTKAEIMKKFFEFLRSEFKPLGITISADLFGQTTVDRGDIGIGQIFEDALPYFDYIAPMNYPSHFAKGFMGYPNPAIMPYEVIKLTMMTAVERTIAASSSVSKLRPWLQAFDMGAVYDPKMVRAQIQGVYDTGVTSWMLWDAANRYNKGVI